MASSFSGNKIVLGIGFSSGLIFKSGLDLPDSLLDILLTGTFLQVKTAVISANIQNKDSQQEPSVKRNNKTTTDNSHTEERDVSSKRLKKET